MQIPITIEIPEEDIHVVEDMVRERSSIHSSIPSLIQSIAQGNVRHAIRGYRDSLYREGRPYPEDAERIAKGKALLAKIEEEMRQEREDGGH